MLSAQLNQLLQIAGTNNRYQFIVLFLFTIIFMTTDFFFISLPYLEMSPYVTVTYKDQTTNYRKLDYDICLMKENNTLDYTIDTINNNQSSLVIDMASYCNKVATSLIGVSIFIGLIIGSCVASLIVDRLGRNNTIVTIYPIYIGVLITFFFVPNYHWMIYSFLFAIGMLSSIITIALITYICEIIKPDKIAAYVTILISGSPIAGFIYNYLFYLCRNLSWRYILFGVAGSGILIYIAIITYVRESPIYFLNNGNIRMFKINLNRIARNNNTLILDEDLAFLQVTNEGKTIYSDSNEETYCPSIKNKNLIGSIQNNNSLWKMTMNNYSPLDLIRYKSQLTNFFVLSFLWALNTIILYGLVIYSRNIEFKQIKSYYLVSAVFFLINLFGDIFIFVFIIIDKFNPHHFLQCFQLISLAFFLISLALKEDLDSSSSFSIMLLYCSRMCWSCSYTLIYIISAKIYPSMLRSKGLSYNRAIGVLFGLGGPYLIEKNMENKDFIIYYIALTFFGIVFTYVLPEEYESIYQVPENDKDEEREREQESEKSILPRDSLILQISDVHFDAKIFFDDDKTEEGKK